jgi:AmmeMemoRadiSam system protein A
METPVDLPTIAPKTRRALLELVRETIAAQLHGTSLPAPPLDDSVLLEPRGAFVTLKIEGALRGCIGRVVGNLPLWLTVRENAIAAAFHDPRFPALTTGELELIAIEISALTPLRVVSADEIIVGRDGLILERGAARGLLLPQVAVEYGWDRETFLDHTCRKAGLDPGSWRHRDTVISTFSAAVFGDDEFADFPGLNGS